jgi:hypothetical protein
MYKDMSKVWPKIRPKKKYIRNLVNLQFSQFFRAILYILDKKKNQSNAKAVKNV